MNKLLTAFSTVAFTSTIAHGATIAWSVEEMLNQNQISTNGILVEAVNFGGAEATVAGVTFEAFNVDTGSNLSTDNFSTLMDVLKVNESYFVGADSGWDATSVATIEATDLLDTHIRDGSLAENVVTLTELQIGQHYELQLFFSDDGRSTTNGDSVLVDTLDSIVAASLGLGSSNSVGDDVMIFTGTFTADAVTQDFTVSRLDQGTDPAFQFAEIFINAGQLRAVPEPSAYAMLAGLLALTSVMIRRRSW